MARTPAEEAAIARGLEEARRAIEANARSETGSQPQATKPKRRREPEWNELCQPCGDCPDCTKAARDARDVKALRVALKQALGHIARMAGDLEAEVMAAAPSSDEVRYGWTQDPTIKGHSRDAGAGRRFIARVESLTRSRRRKTT